MTTQPTSTMIGALTEIWERVLQQSPIGPDDNFFDLGGDSLTAVTLFLEIEKLCGRQLPTVLIYNAPTLSALVVELERAATSRFPPLFLLRPGRQAPPVFIAHGLGGSVIDFYRLLTYIESDNAIYGMQARGTDGIDAPLETIEEMAQYHLEAIRELQPHGPYILVGYSLGGLVCLEIAQRLTAMHEKVSLLAMLDAYPFRKYLSWFQRLLLSTRLALKKVSIAIGMSAHKDEGQYPTSPAELHAKMFAGRKISVRNQQPVGLSTPAMERSAEISKEALRRYKPKFYPERMRFVRAAIVTDFPADPVAVWSSLVKTFDVETVPGDHLGMIATHPDALGAVISRYLKEAAK